VLSGGDKDWPRLVAGPGCSAIASRGKRLGINRHGADRPGGGRGAPRRSACRSTISQTVAGSRPKIEEELHADLLGEASTRCSPAMDHHLDQLPRTTPATFHLLSARPALKHLRPQALCGQHRARRGDRRERAHSHDRGRRTRRRGPSTCFEHEAPRSNPKLARLAPRRQGSLLLPQHGLGHESKRPPSTWARR